MDSCKQIYKYLLKQSNQVVALVTHGKALHHREKALFSIVNQYVNNGWRLGNVSQNEITIITDSPHIANRLRFHSSQILADIRKLESYKILSKLNIKVKPTESEPPGNHTHKNNRKLNRSQAGKKHLEILSDSVSDPELKASLSRLAKHLGTKSGD